jgi:hypothetical protein
VPIVFIGIYQGKGPFGRAQLRWDDNIKTDFRGVGSQKAKLIMVNYGKLQIMVMYFLIFTFLENWL